MEQALNDMERDVPGLPKAWYEYVYEWYQSNEEEAKAYLDGTKEMPPPKKRPLTI